MQHFLIKFFLFVYALTLEPTFSVAMENKADLASSVYMTARRALFDPNSPINNLDKFKEELYSYLKSDGSKDLVGYMPDAQTDPDLVELRKSLRSNPVFEPINADHSLDIFEEKCRSFYSTWSKHDQSKKMENLITLQNLYQDLEQQINTLLVSAFNTPPNHQILIKLWSYACEATPKSFSRVKREMDNPQAGYNGHDFDRDYLLATGNMLLRLANSTLITSEMVKKQSSLSDILKFYKHPFSSSAPSHLKPYQIEEMLSLYTSSKERIPNVF